MIPTTYTGTPLYTLLYAELTYICPRHTVLAYWVDWYKDNALANCPAEYWTIRSVFYYGKSNHGFESIWRKPHLQQTTKICCVCQPLNNSTSSWKTKTRTTISYKSSKFVIFLQCLMYIHNNKLLENDLAHSVTSITWKCRQAYQQGSTHAGWFAVHNKNDSSTPSSSGSSRSKGGRAVLKP